MAEPTIAPPNERVVRCIVFRCPYPLLGEGSCTWTTRHEGGFQEQVAMNLYRDHVEAEHLRPKEEPT